MVDIFSPCDIYTPMSGFTGDSSTTPPYPNMAGIIAGSTVSLLGYGIPGMQSKGGLIGGGAGPTGGSGMVGSAARGRSRKVLRRAFGNSQLMPSMVAPTCAVSGKCRALYPPGARAPAKITPFRAAMTAGDPNGTVDSAASPILPGSTQVAAKVPTLRTFGGVHNDGHSLFTGNPKYVYDGSDYVRFRRLQAQNRNYNDLSFGGDQSHATQVALRAIRRF